ncbi:MAG: hypothetical protein EA399_07820 [Desulfovibrionales bacterium]|nr:MAG: hypothetical protein EA399_07820 [Desulfovibrionales bacterium]
MTTYADDTMALIEDISDETLASMQAAAREHARQAAMQKDMQMFCPTLRWHRRPDPEPIQVRDRWED